MNAEFQWWLLILGIVIGGALVYLVLADVQGDRIDEEPEDAEAADLPDGAAPEATVNAASTDGAGRARPRASAVDDPDVEGDRAEPETPIADAP